MLHVCDYIQRYGAPINYDGYRGENVAKIKTNAKLKNKNKDTPNLDIKKIITEEDIIN